MAYKFKFKPTMIPDEFENENTDYFQELWLNSYPYLAYMLNDGDLEHYYSHIDRNHIMDIMMQEYEQWLQDNL